MINASCLCGAIRFTLDCELKAPRYCYCEFCTKFAGTSPATWAMGERAKIDVTTSLESLEKYDSGRGQRCFCTRCGSPIWFESHDYPEIVAIPLGVLDDGDVPPPEMHIFVDSKPGWCAITDDLPAHETYPS